MNNDSCLFTFLRSIWPSKHHTLDVKPLDHFKQLVESGRLQPVLDSAYAYEQGDQIWLFYSQMAIFATLLPLN